MYGAQSYDKRASGAENSADAIEQLVDDDRLDEDMVGSGAQAAGSVRSQTFGGDNDDRQQPLCVAALADALDDTVTVHAGHPQIDQDTVEVFCGKLGEAILAADAFLRNASGHDQHIAQDSSVECVVLDTEKAQLSRHAASRSRFRPSRFAW